ncbi:MAG: hypothetical protein ACRCWW_07210 [Scandinavium sp.]
MTNVPVVTSRVANPVIVAIRAFMHLTQQRVLVIEFIDQLL